MPKDKPIAYTEDGRPLFDNAPSVVCVIVENKERKILAVRRANEPGKGLLGLPGGYHMRGETWQQAGAREVLEETGVVIDAEHLRPFTPLVTDRYGNNLTIAATGDRVDQEAHPVDGEATEVVWIGIDEINMKDWAFERHCVAAVNYLFSVLGDHTQAGE